MGQAQIWTLVLTNLMSSASNLVLLCIWGSHSHLWGGWILPLDQAFHWCLVGSSPSGLGGCTPVTREAITHHLCNLSNEPSINVAGISSWDTWHWGSLVRKQHFIVPTESQWTHVQRLSPQEQRGLTLNTLADSYKSKKQSSTHIWLHVTLLAIPCFQCYVTFMF
jgi:hypothetical protein